jgi:hypothetical protein
VPATRLSSSRPLSTAPTIPGIAPAAMGIKPLRTRLKRSRAAVVPRAIRTPISCVLRATAYETIP